MNGLGNMHFAAPWFLGLLVILPVLITWRRKRDQNVTLRYSDIMLVRSPVTSWRVHIHWLPDVLEYVVILLLIISLARPQASRKLEIVHGQGVDIILALDISGSMAALDFDPENRLRPKIGEPWIGSGKNPTGMTQPSEGGTARGLHAEQHFEYHRPLKVGDVLKAENKPGDTWEKEGRRGGKLKFSESITEYRDQNNELVVTARSIGVVTEKAPD